MTHYISPYRTDKNIGKAINDAIAQLNTHGENWICLMDMDILWLRPDSKEQLEWILHTTDCDILGPATNRLAMPTQLIERFQHQSVFDQTDITFHMQLANECHTKHYDEVFPIKDILAGFCLCFKVNTWERLGRFQEESLQFDSLFCTSAMNANLKLGIMTGLYLFHLYRMWDDNPKQSVKHLLNR